MYIVYAVTSASGAGGITSVTESANASDHYG